MTDHKKETLSYSDFVAVAADGLGAEKGGCVAFKNGRVVELENGCLCCAT